MQYEEEFHVQRLVGKNWVSVESYDSEYEATDGLNFHDNGVDSWRWVRDSRLVGVTRLRAK